jgi:hypothetical protein
MTRLRTTFGAVVATESLVLLSNREYVNTRLEHSLKAHVAPSRQPGVKSGSATPMRPTCTGGTPGTIAPSIGTA